MLPCEVAVKSAIPAIRASLAKVLIEKHGLTQECVARLLGVTQAAVSQYSRSVRGHLLNLESCPEIMREVERFASDLVDNDGLPASAQIRSYCNICKLVRSRKLLCPAHRSREPSLSDIGCDVCTHLIL